MLEFSILALEGRQGQVLDLLHGGGEIPSPDVGVSPLGADHQVINAPVALEPLAEKLLGQSVRACDVDVAHTGRIRGVQQLPGPLAQRGFGAVMPKVGGAMGGDVGGATDRRQAKSDAAYRGPVTSKRRPVLRRIRSDRAAVGLEHATHTDREALSLGTGS